VLYVFVFRKKTNKKDGSLISILVMHGPPMQGGEYYITCFLLSPLHPLLWWDDYLFEIIYLTHF